jgi:hypothetical protein
MGIIVSLGKFMVLIGAIAEVGMKIGDLGKKLMKGN